MNRNQSQQPNQTPHTKAKYYNFMNSKKRWTEEEDRILIIRYRNEKAPLMKICEDHGRSPYAIMTRLIKLKCVDKPVNTIGFDEFTNTILYNEEWVRKLTPEECSTVVGSQEIIVQKIAMMRKQIEDLEKQLDF